MPKLRKARRKAVAVVLPEDLIKSIDDLSDELESSRSYVIECMVEYCFDHLDDLFPYEETEQS